MDYPDFASYADGYLTGANATLPSAAGQNTHLWGRVAWLENSCQRRPLELYANALGALKRYLKEHRQ
jgi:hypothetical protein